MPVPGTAFLLERVGGWLGFLGPGWIYAGRPRRGLLMLVRWLVFVGIEALRYPSLRLSPISGPRRNPRLGGSLCRVSPRLRSGQPA